VAVSSDRNTGIYTDHAKITGNSDEDTTDTTSELSGLYVGMKMRVNWLGLRGSGASPSDSTESTEFSDPMLTGEETFDRPTGTGWV